MADQRIQCSEEMVGAGHPTKQDTLNRLMLVEHENDGTHKSGNIHGLEPTDSPEFVTVKLSGLSDGVIPYNVDADTGLADGPSKTDVDDAVTKKHAAVTIDGTSPLSLSTQALSLKNDADAAITEVDTGTLANSDTVIPTSKAVKTVTDTKTTLADVKADVDVAAAISATHTQGTDTTLGAMTADIDMGTHQVTALDAPAALGEAIRQTAKITEAALESAVDASHAAVTVSAPIVLTGQAIELKNNAVSPAQVTAIDTDGTLAGNADTALATQKATKTYADLKLAKASNLSDVSNAATAFGNIKQAASTSATGVVELATVTEAVAGTSTSLVPTANGVAAGVAVVSNPKMFAQAVNMTAAASGSSGIYITSATDTGGNLNFAYNNFTLVWEGSLPDWTPSSGAENLLKKYQDASNRWAWYVSATGTFVLYVRSGGTTHWTLISSAASLVNGTSHLIGLAVTREAPGVAGSGVLYVDGLPLGSSISISADDTPPDISNTGTLYIQGTEAARTAGNCSSAYIYNRALSAAEVLDLYRNGVHYADKWGSQTALAINATDDMADDDSANWTATGATIAFDTDHYELTSAGGGTAELECACSGLSVGKKYRWDIEIKNGTDSSIVCTPLIRNNADSATIATGTAGTTGAAFATVSVEWTATETNNLVKLSCAAMTDTKNIELDDSAVYEIGATLALEPEGIESSAWKDSSDNDLDATYPAAGSSFVRRTNTLSYTASAPLNMDSGDVSILNDASNTVHAVETTLTDDDLHIPTSGAVYAAMASAATHPQQHAITSASDHTSAASAGYVLKADANGLPVSGTNTDDEIAAAVTATHTQDTDTDLGTLGTKNPPIDADKAIYRDSTASDALVTSTWTQVKAFLKTYFDTVYLTGDVFYGSNYASLADALTAAEGGTLIIDSDFTTGTDEIPATVSVEVKYGAVITVSTGATLTISGPFKAGAYQVFSCTGTGKVLFSGYSRTVYPQWWGATGSGTDDDAPALRLATYSLSGCYGTVKIPKGTYLLDSASSADAEIYIDIYDYVNVIGDGMDVSTLKLGASKAPGNVVFILGKKSTAPLLGSRFADFTIDFNGANNLSTPSTTRRACRGIHSKEGGVNTLVERVKFKENPGNNNISFGCSSRHATYPQGNIIVRNTIHKDCGSGLTNNYQDDHSSIYCNGDYLLYENNLFEADRFVKGACYEIHGSHSRAVGNKSRNYQKAFWVFANYEDIEDVIITDDKHEDCGSTISLSSTSPYKTSNVSVVNSVFKQKVASTTVTVVAATTANITIATSLNNGDVIDGVTLATGNNVLVKNQTNQSENGIYTVAASPARATVADSWAEYIGQAVEISGGTVNGSHTYICSALAGGILDTTPIDYSELYIYFIGAYTIIGEIDRLYIANCHFPGQGYTHIRFLQVQRIANFSFVNNEVSDFNNYGITIAGLAVLSGNIMDNLVIQGNVFTDVEKAIYGNVTSLVAGAVSVQNNIFNRSAADSDPAINLSFKTGSAGLVAGNVFSSNYSSTVTVAGGIVSA